MGLIQGPTGGHSEPRAEDVAHMTWKAGVGSRAPSVAGGRSYAPSMRGDDQGGSMTRHPWSLGMVRGGLGRTQPRLRQERCWVRLRGRQPVGVRQQECVW